MASLVVSLFLPKIYKATTNLLVSESKIGPGVELPAWQYATLATYEPFVDNDAMVRKAIERFHLDQPPYSLTVDTFRRKDILDVRALKSTRLVEIDVEFPDAHVAADLANFVAQSAVKFNAQLGVTDTTASRTFLAQQLDEAEEKLAEADRHRTKTRERAHIENLDKELNILLAEKEQLATQSETLQLALVQDEGKAKVLQEALAQEPGTYRLIKSLLSDRFAEKALDKKESGGDPPASISEETLNTTKEEFRHDFVETMASVQAEKAGAGAASERLKEVNANIGALLSKLAGIRGELDKADYDYKLARDAVEIANHNYQNAAVNASSKAQDIEQLAPAVVPEKPVRPRLILNLLLGALAGLIFFAVIAAVRESLRELQAADWDAVDEDHPVQVSS